MTHAITEARVLSLELSHACEQSSPPDMPVPLELSFLGFSASACAEYRVILVGDRKYKVFSTAKGRNYYVLGSD